MRAIDAEDPKLLKELKFIREAEYQIYGNGSWGFTAKCERAIEDAPTIQPDPHWIPVTKEEMFKAGYEGKEIRFRVDGRLFAIRELAQ